ncbi:flagellar brake protein [Alkalimarinus sediminis]|uniref:Flagellar brake protein n=1 Tax=Alkalimarinus sediminis TaxID=1632866 RepID=A0A9E8HL23_9ALTE|nr:flagellar brake protein [Alkalimarinus sediminis]UZW76419.1 flagellar brake protein [Alkalimarinus sediminis]
MPEDLNSKDSQRRFEALGVSIGSSLTIETMSPNRRMTVKVMGYVVGKSVLVTPPMKDGKEQLLEIGESVAVRMLIRKQICAFETRVKYRSLQPYSYYHLEYPTELVSLQVRSSERVDVNLPVLINSDFDIGMGDWPKHGVITNMSKTGAAITSTSSFGEKGHEVIVVLDIEVSGLKRSLALNAVIRNKEIIDGGSDSFSFGVQFVDLKDEDTLSLTGFIYENELGT